MVRSDVYMRYVSNVQVFGRIISMYLSCTVMRLDRDDGWLVSGVADAVVSAVSPLAVTSARL